MSTTKPSGGPTCPCTGWRIVGYALAPALAGLLVVTYLISPAFYLEYVLEKTNREHQFVELLGETAALVGGILLLLAAHMIWHPRKDAPEAVRLSVRRHRKAALVIAVVGVAALFLFAEEISWGQKFGKWNTPVVLDSPETNLHNSDLIPFSVQTLGSLFIAAVFFGIPIAWLMRDKFPAANALELAVATGPAITIVAFGFVWKKFKNLYVMTAGKESDFYNGFIEQINEHKEMFVALGLFVYGLTCLSRARALRRNDQPTDQA